MSRISIAMMILLVFSDSLFALDTRLDFVPVADGSTVQVEQQKKRNQREVLREALKSPIADVPPSTRQMSFQEKAALRQQLQKQRLELLK